MSNLQLQISLRLQINDGVLLIVWLISLHRGTVFNKTETAGFTETYLSRLRRFADVYLYRGHGHANTIAYYSVHTSIGYGLVTS
jgi:hypothetical protein